MKIINRYVLKEHVGPFVFALSALTSLLLLQYIARRFGDLVGKGLSWQVITEFFLLSIPFTVAMTLPMAVLVAVLYAFSRLASENEITALKAGGVSTRSLITPALIAASILAVFMLWFNDQLLSRANHELATLQTAILRTKPTFALKPQVINAVKEGQLYLRSDQIDQEASGRLHGVTIFDVSDAARRRSIYADSGALSFAANKRDLVVHLYHGMMMSAPTDKPGELSRIYYRENIQKVREVANSLDVANADSTSKGEREMTVCEMQKEFVTRDLQMQRAYIDSALAAWRVDSAAGKKRPKPAEGALAKPGGIGALYCGFITNYLKVKPLQAAELPAASVRTRQQPATQQPATQQPAIQPPTQAQTVVPQQVGSPPPPTPAPVVATPAPSSGLASQQVGAGVDLSDAKIRLDDARHWRNRYGVEIQKKFSLAFACIVFVLVGAPIALRFPRGGVGLVMGVGFVVFAIYYIGLIGGESLANKGIVSPFWAMWIDNIIFLVVGIALITQMGNENTTQRGGHFAERVDAVRAWFQQRRGARA